MRTHLRPVDVHAAGKQHCDAGRVVLRERVRHPCVASTDHSSEQELPRSGSVDTMNKELESSQGTAAHDTSRANEAAV